MQELAARRGTHVVLCDIGDVLAEASGVATLLPWMQNRVSTEELWELWLTSPNVGAFETGRLLAEEFADRIIAHFRLAVPRPECHTREM